MDKREAIEILRVHRPGTDDAQDPRVIEALQLAKQDAELATWLEAHRAFDAAMRAKLKEIPVPENLAQKILQAEAVRRGRIIPWQRIMPPLAAAAAVIFLASVLWISLAPSGENFSAARERLAKTPQKGYSMDFFSTNLTAIHAYLTARQCPDYTLPKPLARLQPLGCASKIEWHDRPVTMVCLRDGRDKQGNDRDFYLFALDGTNFRNAPAPGETKFEKVHRLMTASWMQEGKLYILAGPGDENELKRFLD